MGGVYPGMVGYTMVGRLYTHHGTLCTPSMPPLHTPSMPPLHTPSMPPYLPKIGRIRENMGEKEIKTPVNPLG